eukprot:COSAG01_NODE_57408_length_312_cov_1.145540_1_plen_29_part_01
MLLSDVVQLLGLFTSLCSAAPQPPHQGRG